MQKSLLVLLLIMLSACSQTDPVIVTPRPTQGRTAIELPTTTPLAGPPTPTFVPTAEHSAAAPPAASTPVTDSRPPAATTDATRGVPVPPPSGGTVLTFPMDDTAWIGGWRNKGESRYKGRTATWIYGANTAYSTMRVTFTLTGQPAGQAELQVEGMDSEDSAKTPILITVNDRQIFRGADPLPNDNDNLAGGTWGRASFPFSADLLHAGNNTITIQTLVNGQVGLPPFFMLDYANLVLSRTP